MFRIILFVAFSFSFVFGITLEYLKNQPQSYARDFYISQFLEQNISTSEADDALKLVKHLNNKLLHKFAEKVSDDKIIKKSYCLKLSNAEMLKEKDLGCLDMALSYKRATKIDKKLLKGLGEKLFSDYPLKAQILNFMSHDKLFYNTLRDKEMFFRIFNETTRKYRQRYMNHPLSYEQLELLQSDKRFNKTVELIVASDVYDELQTSLLKVDAKDLKYRATFLLGINALRLNKPFVAVRFLEQAYKKAYYQFDKDNVSFWLYRITEDDLHLRALMSSKDINIYTIYAHEKTETEFDNVYSFKCDKKSSIKVDKSTPFVWMNLWSKAKKSSKEALFEKASSFLNCDDMPFKAMFYSRYYDYQKHFFLQPYGEYLNSYDAKRKALVYAIGRAESNFIPASVSSAHALGLMQFMPFLARDTAHDLGIKDFSLFDMFKPKISYMFANHHLNFLEKKVKHPLYISYAYNGGIGFTTRMLKSDSYFPSDSNNTYEPFLSMELVPYKESRRYAKKVLSNYIVYSKLLGIRMTLKSVLKEL